MRMLNSLHRENSEMSFYSPLKVVPHFAIFSLMYPRYPFYFATLDLCSHVLAEPAVWGAKISGVNEKIHQQREDNISKL